MADGAKRQSDEIEREGSLAVTTILWGLLWILIAGLLAYVTGILKQKEPLIAYLGYGFAVVSLLSGLAMILAAFRNVYVTRKRPTFPFACPYCATVNRFLAQPTEDFTCEGCHRDVRFRNGEPVPVQTIICQACRAEHKVPATIDRYVCDQCNRPLRIPAMASGAPSVARIDSDAVDQSVQPNQDVLISAYDKRRENDLVFRVQDLMVVGANEARRLLKLVTTGAPLMVAFDVAPIKAEAIRRQLQELGATVQLRANASEQAGVRSKA